MVKESWWCRHWWNAEEGRANAERLKRMVFAPVGMSKTECERYMAGEEDWQDSKHKVECKKPWWRYWG